MIQMSHICCFLIALYIGKQATCRSFKILFENACLNNKQVKMKED